MWNNQKVSVIVPVYNVSRFLPECIESVINQTYGDFELILVDDGSTDGSGIICDNYASKDNRIIVLHKTNGGLTSARNAGLSTASGEWIMHLDGDDWIEPDMLFEFVATADREKADLVEGSFRKVWDNGKVLEYSLPYDHTDKETLLKSYMAYSWTTIWGGMAKKSLYDQYGLKSPEGTTFCEDFHLGVRLWYYAKKVVTINKIYYNYRQVSSSLIHNVNTKSEEDERRVYLDIIDFFKKEGEYKTYKKCLDWRLLKSAKGLLSNIQTHKEFSNLCQAVTFGEIFTCPFINKKTKMMTVLIKLRLFPVAGFIVSFRRLF